MTRRTPLRKSWLRRATAPLRKVGARAKRRQKAGLVYGPYHKWIRTLPCVLRGHPDHECWGVIDGHHVVPVGRGGQDYANEVPACRVRAHADADLLTPEAFAAKWGVDLRSVSRRLAEEAPE